MTGALSLFTVTEAAKLYQLHPWTIYSAIRLHELECYRVGHARRSIRMNESQLRDWLEKGRQTNTELGREVGA
jgi:excisionase family DNA binding protein